MASVNVFVYGTLKQDQPNHFLMEKSGNGVAKFLGKGHTVHSYPLVVATKNNVPFLLYKEGTGQSIHGEVYQVDSAMLVVLDQLERHPDWYERDTTPVLMEGDDHCECKEVQCWAYFLKRYKPELLDLPYMECYDNSKMGSDKKNGSSTRFRL